jgi:kynurenine formamidase
MKHLFLSALLPALFTSACTTAPPDPDDLDEVSSKVGQQGNHGNHGCTYGVARWGANDEAGQSNTQTDQKAKDAAKLIKTGRRWRLAHEYNAQMPTLPFPGLLGFQLGILGPIALGTTVAQEEQVHSEIGQVGTQMDTLGHMCFMQPGTTDPLDATCYGGNKVRDVVTPTGLTKLGIEKIRPYFTRGFLLDVPRALNGGQRLAPGRPVTAAMIHATLAAQGQSLDMIEEGDVVLVRTGQEEFWDTNPVAFYGSTPGLDLSAAQLLASRCVGTIGADNWPVDVIPKVDNVPSGTDYPVHEQNLRIAGIPQIEALALSELADDLAAEFRHHPNGEAYQFAFVMNPMPMTGATGSPALPLALK